MASKEELGRNITGMINGIRHRPWVLMYLPLVSQWGNQFDEVMKRCLDLQEQLFDVGDGSRELLGLEKQFYSIEALYRRLRARLIVLPSFLVIYLGFIVTVLFLHWVDFGRIVKVTLGVDAPEKLIILGICGAFVYLWTSLIGKFESPAWSQSHLSGLGIFSIRLLLAIIVPIVLVVLFFTKEGKVAEVKISPELLSFGCGYSSKLVIDILNKIVEKASNMIKAL